MYKFKGFRKMDNDVIWQVGICLFLIFLLFGNMFSFFIVKSGCHELQLAIANIDRETKKVRNFLSIKEIEFETKQAQKFLPKIQNENKIFIN